MSNYIYVSNREETCIVSLKDIQYVQQIGRKVFIRATDKIHYKYGNLKQIEALLDGRFYQCLKFTYINLEQIKTLKKQTIIFKPGSTLMVGRDCFVRVKVAFTMYHNMKLRLDK